MKKELTIAILAVGLTIGMASLATAETLEQETEVDVEISGVTQLDVRPSSLSYTDTEDTDALSPGDARTVSDLGFEHIEVENIGSERIGNIYAQATMHDQQPFGTDTDADGNLVHNTGNFVTMSLETANRASYDFGGELSDVDNMHYLNRVEYVEDNAPTYIQVEDGDFDYGEGQDAVDEADVGRVRVGGAEYFFVVYTLDSDGTYMAIGNAPHTSTVLGTTDFTSDGDGYSVEELDSSDTSVSDLSKISSQRFVTFDTESEDYVGQDLIADGDALIDPEDDSETTGEGDDEISASDITAEVRNYNLYYDEEDNFLVRSKFNVLQSAPDEDWTADEDASGGQEYILEADSISESLQPGDNFPINFGVQVPQGVDQNAIEEGTVTVISETFE